jgi:hypothetical protein
LSRKVEWKRREIDIVERKRYEVNKMLKRRREQRLFESRGQWDAYV